MLIRRDSLALTTMHVFSDSQEGRNRDDAVPHQHPGL